MTVLHKRPLGSFLDSNPFECPLTLGFFYREKMRAIHRVAPDGPLHQEALSLLFVQGLSYDEISEVLNVPVGTVKSRLFAAKRALRERMTESEGPRR